MADEPVKRGTTSELTIAAVVNVLTYRALASAAGLPGWSGALVAASAMAIAADPAAPETARRVAGTLSAPGALAVQLMRSEKLTLNSSDQVCCAACNNGQGCEGMNND
jgi:hypothetical protein